MENSTHQKQNPDGRVTPDTVKRAGFNCQTDTADKCTKDSTLNQFDTIHIIIPSFLKINFIIVFSSPSQISTGLFFRLNFTCINTFLVFMYQAYTGLKILFLEYPWSLLYSSPCTTLTTSLEFRRSQV